MWCVCAPHAAVGAELTLGPGGDRVAAEELLEWVAKADAELGGHEDRVAATLAAVERKQTALRSHIAFLTQKCEATQAELVQSEARANALSNSVVHIRQVGAALVGWPAYAM